MRKISFINQRISSHLAFLFILILSFLVAWYVLATGEEVVENSRNSASFNLDKRIQKEVLQNEER